MKGLTKSQGIVYKENLNRCGARLYETITLLEEYNKTKNWKDVEKKTIEYNILNKKSSNTIKTILKCVKNRFKDIEGLPMLEEVSSFVSSNIPDKAKIQVLLPYIFKTDLLIRQYTLKLVYPNLHSKNNVELTKKIFHEFFEKEANEHPELNKWSENSEVRWIRSLLSLLRKFGFMKPAPSLELEKPQLRIETFTFYCLFLLFEGNSGRELIENETWKLFGLSTAETERFFENSQMKGWIHYSRSGDIISINTEYNSLEGWINDLG